MTTPPEADMIAREADTSRERMERLHSLGCADYLHMALLARAERAEAEALEQARLNGMGAERELKLMAERDEAYRAGQDDMRNWAARWAGKMSIPIGEGIRALPLKDRPD